ncbi:hypothetical protein JCM16303_005732 [Sporobolomyces ruberrimus]
MTVTLERRVRESSYHPMASDSSDGGVSDGDPPQYSTSTTSSLPIAALPTPATYSARGNQDSLVGTTGGAANVVANPSTSKKAGKRSFEELEDIVFSNPKSFATLAFAIAESRGVTLIVSDDRTHKVTSAYMHVTCAYRKAGCPFILKLTKAKEGGWVLKGAKAMEGKSKPILIDIKQRSIYRCRHPAGATPEIPTGPTVSHPGSLYAGSATTSYPMSTTAEGGVSKPKAARGSSRVSSVSQQGGVYEEQYESSIGKATTKGPGRPRSSAPASAPVGGFGSPASRMTPITGIPPSAPASADRALAPPFERSPFERSINLQAKIVPVLRGGEPSNGFSAPRGDRGNDSNYDSPRLGGGGGRSSSYDFEHVRANESCLSTVPVIAQSDPSALPDWTNLLRLLSPDVNHTPQQSRNNSPNSSSSSHSQSHSINSLVPLAQVLSHPYMSITPTLFFAETTTKEMRLEALEGLPVEKVGVWNKVWAKKVLMSREAEEKWAKVLEEKRKVEEEEDREEEGEEEEEDRKDGIVKEDTEMGMGNANGYGGGENPYYDEDEPDQEEVGSMYEEE